MQIKDFLIDTGDTDCMGCPIYDPRPPIICADGFMLSVQAGFQYDCQPRGVFDTYECVEVREVSAHEPLLEAYAGEGGVYSFVPLEVVEAVIQRHGGMVND